MKRVFPLILAIMLIGLLAVGCGNKQEISIDTQALAEALLTGDGIFDEPLNAVDEDSIRLLVGEGLTGEEILAYLSSGATAEELLIVTSTGEEEAGECLELLRSHLEDRTLMYSNYLPEEAYKLENAYLAAHGRYVILCVAAGFEAAEEIINAAVK